MDKYLNVRPETIKLTKRKKEVNFLTLVLVLKFLEWLQN